MFFLFFSFFLMFFSLFIIDYCCLILDFLLPFDFLVGQFSLSFCFDYVSCLFFMGVSFISSMVFFYSYYYMGGSFFPTSDYSRFIYLLFFFVISMFFLVFSYSWFSVMLGWDGLGIISFLLVIYYNDSTSLDSGYITIFTNRVGDCFFILSFIFMFYSGWNSFEYIYVNECFLFSLIFILGCMTKSAQMPFSSWLPAAMAAPTPVSSLVHSSTLVTAGVFLLLRFNYLFFSFGFLCFVSLFTMAISGVFAMCEADFKKVVAMSTLSQLGFMVFSISSGFWVFGFLHMLFHAFFKSSLFLTTGNLMHFLLGSQDFRNFGGFYNSFFSKVIFFTSCISLMGFPFSLGFYSKDVILGGLLFHNSSFLSFVFILSCCFTVCYSIRLIYMGYFYFTSSACSISYVEDKFFVYPVFFLFLLCVYLGNFFMFFFIPFLFFSFFDLFVGLLVISIGVSLFFLLSFSYVSLVFFSFMGFISLLSVFFGRFLFFFSSYRLEISWLERVSSKLFLSMLFSAGKVNFGLHSLSVIDYMILGGLLIMMNFL